VKGLGFARGMPSLSNATGWGGADDAY
jgi:hypothetical protein